MINGGLTHYERHTKETAIGIDFALYGSGKFNGSTHQGFMDHMLNAFCFYSQTDLSISLEGDYHIDQHHSLEDLGIALGTVMKTSLTAASPIARFGQCHMVMDEALVRCVIDFSGRPFLHWGLPDLGERIGSLEAEVLQEFFRALTQQAGLCLHLDLLRGSNRHHIVECSFKAFARAFLQAKMPLTSTEASFVLSTKGLLDGFEKEAL